MSLIGLEPAPEPILDRLRWRWTAAMVVGELIGFIPPAVAGVSLVAIGVNDLSLVIGLTIAGLFEGAVIGVAQVRVLQERWPALRRQDWVLATMTAAGFAWFVGMGGSALMGWDAFPTPLAIALVIPASLLALLSMGYLQWRVLRNHAARSGRWVSVTAGAWLAGVLVPVVALSAVPNRWPPTVHVVVGVVAAVGMGFVVGAITGATLEQLARPDPAVAGGEAVAFERSTTERGRRSDDDRARRALLALKFTWTAVSCFVVESIIVGLAAMPAAVFYRWHLAQDLGPEALRLFLLGAALLPAYLLFALVFMFLSAESARLLRWRPPARADLRIADLPVGLRKWARYAIISHLVHVMAGPVFRSTPVWVWYMRRNGATIGRHVWINSLQVGDDCLLNLGDEVVIGAGVHMSAHTVERGLLRLAPVSLGPGTVVGVGAHVGIGVTTGTGTHIGSMSVVPKHARLADHGTYIGIPAKLSAPATDPGAAAADRSAERTPASDIRPPSPGERRP